MHLQKSMFVFSNKFWILSRETCWLCGCRRCRRRRRSLHTYRCVGDVVVMSVVIDFCDIITGDNDCCCCCCCTNGRSILTVDASDTWFICCGRNHLITLLRDCNIFVFVFVLFGVQFEERSSNIISARSVANSQSNWWCVWVRVCDFTKRMNRLSAADWLRSRDHWHNLHLCLTGLRGW